MKLTNVQRADIEFTIEDMFFHLKARLLGKYFTGPKIYFEVVEQTNPLETLEGVYNFTYNMLYGAGAKPNPKRVKQLMKITGNYLDAERLRTVNHVLNAIESAKTFDDVKEVVEKQMEKTNGYVNMLVGNEIRNIQANAEKEGIEKLGAAIGVEDPVVCKLGVVDDKLCKYCRPLWHTDENPMIPKVYKLSELKDGYMNHKDPQPTILASHPSCRHVTSMIPPGFGFTNQGVITFKGFGYDIYAEQRGE